MAALAEIHPNAAGDTIEFLERIAGGGGPLNSALAVGWSPKQLRDMLKSADFREMLEDARERSIETVEEGVQKLARKGNLGAQQLILFCLGAHRGWRPPTQRVAVNSQTTVKIENVEGVKAAVLEALRSGEVKALQPGGALDIEDAEVVDGG